MIFVSIIDTLHATLSEPLPLDWPGPYPLVGDTIRRERAVWIIRWREWRGEGNLVIGVEEYSRP